MSRLLISLVLAFAALSASAQTDYKQTASKASRFFVGREWASAQALYGLILDKHPDADSVYVRAIISASMLGDTIGASHLLEQAMNAGVGFSSLMSGVKSESFEIGEAEVYEAFLLRSQRDCPWLERAIDAELLDYYCFRNDGVKMVAYARKMLAGLPDSTIYLSVLARGYARSGDFDNALGVWRRIIELDADNYDALLSLGNYFDIKGRQAEAADYLARAQRIKPTPYVAARLEALCRDGKKR